MKPQDFSTCLIAEVPHLRRFARGLCGDASLADDLVQDCLERAIKKQHLYDTTRPLRAWLYTMLRNIFVSQWRRSSQLGIMADVDDLGNQEPSMAPQQEQNLSIALITQALDKLPHQQREILLMISLEELSYKEAADIIGVPIGTIMSRLSRARNALHHLLEESGTSVLRVVK